jgi:DNA-binding transcriptional MerR regulator
MQEKRREPAVEWSIQDIARLAGTTSRTLRHYGQLGILQPSRTGANGYRFYDERALLRLQRILMLRDIGLGLPAIADVLAGHTDDVEALSGHLAALHRERERIDRQIRSVEATIRARTEGKTLMAKDMLDGFDHTIHRREVEQRWGAASYAAGDEWWRSMGEADRSLWMLQQQQLASDWASAAGSGTDADSAGSQDLARRQYEWLAGIPGTPRGPSGAPSKDYFVGLGELYAADERFAAHYGGPDAAAFVRDAMAHFARENL